MLKKVILHLCADIGSDSWFYANNDEYEVIKVGKKIGVENYTPPDNVYGVIANPVCTEFSFAKWANNKGDGDVEEGMFLVNHCLRIIKQCSPKFWVIENPATGRLKEFLGAPKLTISRTNMAHRGLRKLPCGESLISLKKSILGKLLKKTLNCMLDRIEVNLR